MDSTSSLEGYLVHTVNQELWGTYRQPTAYSVDYIISSLTTKAARTCSKSRFFNEQKAIRKIYKIPVKEALGLEEELKEEA